MPRAVRSRRRAAARGAASAGTTSTERATVHDTAADGALHRGNRPGHDQHPHGPVRRGRADQSAAPARARADPPPRRLGRARPARGLAAHAGGDRRSRRGGGREPAGPAGVDRLRERVGLPLSTYFSGPKIAWILEHVAGARERAESGELAFGNMDAWLLWLLPGGPAGGVHATEVTSASRTMLMDLETLDWHEPSLQLMGIPRALLPEIRSSSEIYGEIRAGPLAGVAIAGIIGDQQAALFGQTCFERGE